MAKVRQVYKEYPVDNNYDLYFIGKVNKEYGSCVALKYHEPSGEGDAHYVDVEFSDGSSMRIFRPDTIDFEVE